MNFPLKENGSQKGNCCKTTPQESVTLHIGEFERVDHMIP
ncbi:hypothetical protein DYBT9275_03682 [Dyadobacter sp. CECT 9275]|uniref:Uncharacterized protein n=1 Tax=Dyadobacter helix TaxID=2822344 RepID=A0A916JI38_9BACT|nr:hypothetical protein DYBT9275_03682 [Dyadobacter sp. CECT 9275]